MTRRRNAGGTSAIAEPARAADADADAGAGAGAGEAGYQDAFAARYMEWMRQVERIEATSLAGLGALLQTAAMRAASAKTWAEWAELAGAGLQEAVDDAARTQGEWLSAVMQCQMEAVKMLLDLGRSSMQAPRGSEGDLGPAWFSPWMAGAGMRPVQIA